MSLAHVQLILSVANLRIFSRHSIHGVHDDIKDKDFELELSWICPESNNQHQLVPKELRDQVDKAARDALKAEMED